MKYINSIFFLLLHINLHSAEHTSLFHLFINLSSDVHNIINKYILQNTYQNTIKKNPILKKTSDARLIIPSSLRTIELILPGITYKKNENPIIEEGDVVLPNEQYLQLIMNPIIHLCNISQQTNDTYQIGMSATKRFQSFNYKFEVSYWDGINNNRISVCSRQHSIKEFNIYLLQQSAENSSPKLHKQNYLASMSGCLHSIMLHANRNRFVISRTLDKKHFVEIYDIIIKLQPEISLIAKKQINLPLKKTIPLDKNNYLALQDNDTLLRLELQEYTNKKKDKIVIHEQSHPHKMRDIAFDKSSITTEGNINNIAFVNTEGEIFVTDMRLFSKPTMVLVHSIKESEKASLHYQNNQLGIMYIDNDNDKWPTRFERFPDCYELVYLKALIKKHTQNGELTY